MGPLTEDKEDGSIKLALGGMIALAAGLGIGRFVYTPILPVMAEALKLSSAEAGLIASANFIGYLLGALIAALPTMNRRRFWLLLGLVVNAATMEGMSAVTSLPMFMALRCIGGAASAFVLVFASAIVLDRVASAQRTQLSAIHFAGVGIGIAISSALVAAQSTWGADWQSLWFGSGSLALLAAFAVLLLIPDDGAERPIARKAASASRSGGLGRLICAYGLVGFGYVITATFLVAIVRETPQAASLEPVIWILFGLTAAPSVALWTWLAGRWSVLPAFSAASLLQAMGVGASVLWAGIPGLVLSAVLLGGTFMGLTALGLAAGRQLSTGEPRRALAAMTAAWGTGQIIGPVLAGVVRDATGSFALPSLCAAAALVLAAILPATIAAQRGQKEIPSGSSVQR